MPVQTEYVQQHQQQQPQPMPHSGGDIGFHDAFVEKAVVGAVHGVTQSNTGMPGLHASGMNYPGTNY